MTNTNENAILVELPVLAGAREHAMTLLEHIPADNQVPVILDASKSRSLAQGFVDELFRQLLQIRSTPTVTLMEASVKTRTHAQRSGDLRDFADRIQFENA